MSKLLLKIFTQLLVLAVLASCGGGSEDEVPSLLTPPDETPPTISTITPAVDDTYLYNDNISFSITFSEVVTVSGVPSLTLSIDGSNFNLPFSSGSGTTTLVFDKNLDMERSDVDGIDFTAIELNGGSIVDIGGNDAVLTITPVNYPAVLVESIRPVLTSVEFNSGELYTTNTAATINSVAMNADEMIISTASDCSAGSFIAYNSAHPYTLSANAINNVYFQLRTFAGNESACTAISITHDNQAPGSPVITQAGDATTSQTDTANWMAITDSGPAGILRYEYAVSTTTDEVGIIAGAGWTDIGTVLTYQITSGVTLASATDYYTLVKAVDNALNESVIGVSSAWQLLSLPVVNSLDINGGDLYTNDVNVTINIDVTNANEMIVSTANDCSTGSWEPYAATKAYILGTTNALNDIYLQFRNVSGGYSSCDQLSITHDDQNPDAPIISQTGDASTSQTDTASWLAISDNGPSGLLRYEYAVSTTADEVGIIAGAGWSDIGNVLTYQLTSGVTLTTATDYYTLVKSIDNALNESSISVSPVWQILVTPTINSLDINGGDLYTNDVNVTINIDVTDADEMIVSTANDCSTGSWEPYAATKAYVLGTANALNNIYLQFRNASGGTSTCDPLSITHDDQAPNSPVLSLTGDGSDIASDTTSWAAVTDNGPSGILRYEFAISTTADEVGIIAGGAWTDIALVTTNQVTSGITLAAATDYYSLVKVIDNALNEVIVASASWQITIPPNPISNLEYSDRTKESISLGWAQPVDNGIPVTDYEIEYKGNGVTVWTLLADGVSTNTSYVHTGLAAETLYEYRVRAYNGSSYSAWSNTLAVETLPDLPFFEPGYKAINVGGSTTNSVVSFADSNDIYLNGVLLTTLNKSDTYVFASTDFDVIEGTQPFFVAGRAGPTNGGASSGNFTWVTQAWVGKEYFFNLTRNGPLKVKIFAFEDTTVTIYNGGSTAAGPQFIAADTGYTFTLNTNASYRLASTGYVGGFVYANQGGNYYDPRPLIPSSTDIIGFPSNSANFSSGTSGNAFSFITSDGSTGSGTLTAGTTYNTNQDAASLYSGNALRFMSTNPVTGISTADSNGLCAAPFMPVAMFKTKYGINTDSDWIAFASDRPVTITQTLPNGTTSTFALTQSGSGANRPYNYYISANQLAGTLYEGTDKFQMWYEPESTAGGAVEDETVMFGWD